MYIDDCRSNQESSYLVTFADDSALLSLLLGTQDGHGAAPDDFTEWCDESHLDLNVNNAKETTADFRRRRHTHRAIQVHDEKVEIAHSYKYLGMIFHPEMGSQHRGHHYERAPATLFAAEAQIF